jgi:hypothetical protein
MRKLKKVLRLCGLVILILLACSGISILGGLPLTKREQYLDNEIKIEIVEEKEEESEGETEKN